jgi:GTP-binding protein Era
VTRCGVVALAGRPNVGKSSLLNALVGEHLGIVSPKPQSTRLPVVGILTADETQFVFTDCPGLLDPAYRLQEVMRAAAVAALGDADVIAHLHPLAEQPAPSLHVVAGLAAAPRAPVLTVYTKADLVGPAARGPVPDDALAVSAVTGEGIAALRDRPPGTCRSRRSCTTPNSSPPSRCGSSRRSSCARRPSPSSPRSSRTA